MLRSLFVQQNLTKVKQKVKSLIYLLRFTILTLHKCGYNK